MCSSFKKNPIVTNLNIILDAGPIKEDYFTLGIMTNNSMVGLRVEIEK